MRKVLSCLLLLITVAGIEAQQKATDLDKSPMDMSYFPQNYPMLKMEGKTKEQPVARVIYSRPQRNDRTIFGGIVRYGDIWRMGANEATEIEFFKNVKINNQTVPKGRYTLYAICNPDKWTIAINTEKDYWGMSQNPKKDELRVDVPVTEQTETVDALTIYFEAAGKNKANLVVMWDKTKVELPFSY